jgi:hypothetical protein
MRRNTSRSSQRPESFLTISLASSTTHLNLYIYRLAVAQISLLISSWQVCIFVNKVGSPIILAAFLASRHVSSKRVMTLTIVPSRTSVSSAIRENGMPRAHSYTTSTRPKRGRETKSLLSSEERMTW